MVRCTTQMGLLEKLLPGSTGYLEKIQKRVVGKHRLIKDLGRILVPNMTDSRSKLAEINKYDLKLYEYAKELVKRRSKGKRASESV